MYQFAVLLRALACILITNSHMEKVYPISAIANGGLLGDVMFFSISGFLLYTVKELRFPGWYCRRLRRVYLPTWITVFLFMLFHAYGRLSAKDAFHLLIWPTDYHFVSSILVLYIVFFAVMQFVNHAEAARQNKHFLIAALSLAVLYFALFYFAFDYSFYHIDNVYKPMIWPLYLAAMLIGMNFRMNVDRFLGKTCVWSWIAMLACGAVYASTKLAFSRGTLPPAVQWLNQFTLLATLYCVFRCFIGLENLLQRVPDTLFAPFRFIADRAFEIYLAQIVIIPFFNTGKSDFPRNFFIVIGVTVLCAVCVHALVKIILQLGELASGGKKRI